jgi:hypothetical protein
MVRLGLARTQTRRAPCRVRRIALQKIVERLDDSSRLDLVQPVILWHIRPVGAA